MAWNDKYWDALDQIYWTLDYVGLKKLRPTLDPERGDYLLVPRSQVRAGNSIYTRRVKAKDMAAHLHTREETLNHVLDIALAIAPDALINRLIAEPLGLNDDGPFESIGREVDGRLGIVTNVFQQDGYFVSPRSALTLEIKLKSPSSPEQIVRYAALLALEEKASGVRENVGLLYVVPAGAEAKLWRSCQLDGPNIRADLIEIVRSRKESDVLELLLDKHDDAVRAMLARMKLASVTWTAFRDTIASVESGLDEHDPAQQCYRRLLYGLRRQIEVHGDTGLTPG